MRMIIQRYQMGMILIGRKCFNINNETHIYIIYICYKYLSMLMFISFVRTVLYIYYLMYLITNSIYILY